MIFAIGVGGGDIGVLGIVLDVLRVEVLRVEVEVLVEVRLGREDLDVREGVEKSRVRRFERMIIDFCYWKLGM